MKNFYIAITFLCAALIAFLILIACMLEDKSEEPQAVAPEVNADGLCVVTVVKTPKPTPVCYTENDVYVMAQAMAGECYEHEYNDMLRVGMTICNRVDDDRFPNTIVEVIKQPSQIHGYSPYNTPNEIHLKAATEVLDNWNAIKNGEDRSWEYEILFWGAGGGTVNIFRSEY